jgi:hypothetical protein
MDYSGLAWPEYSYLGVGGIPLYGVDGAGVGLVGGHYFLYTRSLPVTGHILSA